MRFTSKYYVNVIRYQQDCKFISFLLTCKIMAIQRQQYKLRLLNSIDLSE